MLQYSKLLMIVEFSVLKSFLTVAKSHKTNFIMNGKFPKNFDWYQSKLNLSLIF